MAPDPPGRSARGRSGRAASGTGRRRLAYAAAAAYCPARARHHGGHRCLQRQPRYQAQPQLPVPAGSPYRSRRACRAHHRTRRYAGESRTADVPSRLAASRGRQRRRLAAAHRGLVAAAVPGPCPADVGVQCRPHPGTPARGFCGARDGRGDRTGPGARAARHAGRAVRHAARAARDAGRAARQLRAGGGPGDAASRCRSGPRPQPGLARRPAGGFPAAAPPSRPGSESRRRHRAAAEGADPGADAAAAARSRRSAQPFRWIAGAGRASPGPAGGREVRGMVGATRPGRASAAPGCPA